jgi:hypothetical protein
MRLDIYIRNFFKPLYLIYYLRNPFKIKNCNRKYPVEHNSMFLNYFIKSLLIHYLCIFISFWCKLGCGVD